MRLDGKRILVTGGAGFIGSHLVDALVRRGKSTVRVVDNLSTGKAENLGTKVQHETIGLIQGDLCDPAIRAAALDGVDVVFHLACRGVRHSIGNPFANHDVNATATLEVLAEAQHHQVKRFVHVSSSEVYGTARYAPMDEDHPCFPESVYGAAKLAGECYARAYFRTYGLPTVVVRPFNSFGPRSHFEGDAGEVIPRFCVWALNSQPPVIFGDGTQTRDFIYVEDTASWLCKVAECDELVGETINLGSGRETSVKQLAAIVSKEATGVEMRPVHRAARPGDVHRHLADVTRARRILDFEPKTTLADGIRKLIAHLRALDQTPADLLGQLDEVNWKKAG